MFFKRFISASPVSIDFGLLLLRISIGALMLTHGLPKLLGYSEKAKSFADPFGIGSGVSLALAVFAEAFCSLFVMLGWYTRLALMVLMINMLTILVIVHEEDPFSKKELAFLYLATYIALLFTGPGKYALDSFRKSKR